MMSTVDSRPCFGEKKEYIVNQILWNFWYPAQNKKLTPK